MIRIRFFDAPRKDDALAKELITFSNFKIGHGLRAQGHTKEALEQYYLPYAKDLLNRPPDSGISSDDLHSIWVAHMNVGVCQLDLGQSAEALSQCEQALTAKKMLTDREPDNARHARDWSVTQSYKGLALLALGRIDDGVKCLQESVRIAEALVGRDPTNGSFQTILLEVLHRQASGFASAARGSGIAPRRQAELWQQAIQSLTRCEERLASPELVRIKSQLKNEEKGIGQELNQAREALNKITAANAATKPSSF